MKVPLLVRSEVSLVPRWKCLRISTSVPAGNCSGQVLAISEPYHGDNSRGRVFLPEEYRLLGSMFYGGGSVDVEWGRYGSRIRNIGDGNADGYDELAVANDSWSNSRLEILGGSAGGVGAHKTFSESEIVGSVEVMGDYNGDSKAEIGIGFPHYNDKGNTGPVRLQFMIALLRVNCLRSFGR